MFRSDALFLEMNYVIENLSSHMLQTFINCLNTAKDPAHHANEQMIRNLYSVMNSILHIIESILGQEELPDFYEENLPIISEGFLFILGQDYPSLTKVPTEIIKARGKVVSLIYLYSFKFGEHFNNYKDPMFQAVWQMIEQNKVKPSKESEKLVRITVKYVGEVSNLPSKQPFIKMNLIKIFDILILPNISITEEDMDEYEDSPDAYIKNDLEESDAETRRRHCMKFVQQLSRRFSQEVGDLIGNYINQLLASYE